MQIDFEDDIGSSVQQTPVQTVVKAKRGRPPSKPPSKEVLKSRRRVCILVKGSSNGNGNIFELFKQNFEFIWTNLLLYRQLMPEREEEWIE